LLHFIKHFELYLLNIV